MACLVAGALLPLHLSARNTSGSRHFSLHRYHCSRNDLNDQNEDDRLLEEDMKRIAALQSTTTTSRARPSGKPPKPNDEQFGVRDVVNKFLVADFFFVLLSLAGLVLGLGEKAAFNSSNVLDIWYSLWPLVFQPALGILMAGILLSQLFKR